MLKRQYQIQSSFSKLATEHADRNSAEAESVPEADTSSAGATQPGSQDTARSAETRNIYRCTAACAQPINPNVRHVCNGKWRILHSCNSTAFRQEYRHKLIDALIDVLEARERQVHSTSALLQVGTPESGPSPQDKLSHFLLLDVGPPVQSCCAPETLLSLVV